MKFVVFGGSGFIGSHVVDRLIKTGHHVRVFSRSAHTDMSSAVEFFNGDITNREQVRNAVVGMDVTINLASNVIPATSNSDPVHDVQHNLVGALHILEACVEHGIKKTVFSSSGGTIYGHSHDLPHKETDETNPVCSYGVVKLAIEKYMYMFHELYGLQYCALRISNPYGPGQAGLKPLGAVSTFLLKILSGEKIEIWGDGSVRRDFIYIDDVVESIVLAATTYEANGVFNIGTGNTWSLNEVIRCIEQVTARKAQVLFKDARNFDLKNNALDVSLAAESFNWKAKTNLSDGILKTATHICTTIKG